MSVFIKICGITNIDDAKLALAYGASALGFIFYPKSKRYCPIEKAEIICRSLPPFVYTVGVFVNEEKNKILEINQRCYLSAVQLHGDESVNFCASLRSCSIIKVFHIENYNDIKKISSYIPFVSSYLLDTKSIDYGGTGKTFDWDIAIKAKRYNHPIILSGGLSSQNVNEAIRYVKPDGIDLCSSIEAYPGKKDPQKLADFFSNLKLK